MDWRSALVVVSILFLLVGPGTAQHDELDDGQPVQPAEPADAANAQLSWQSAFWALVAIALNTATQPSGRIVGLPSSWGPALKCSPVFCLVNAIEALGCIRLRRDFEWTIVVAPHKYDNDADPAHSDVATLQRNTLIRVIAFVLGPLLQATKLYACQGVFWTKVLAAIYLGSFLCDELTLCLLWLTGSTTGRNSVTGLVEALFGSGDRPSAAPPSPRITAPGGDDVRENGRPTGQVLAIAASYLFLVWFAITAAAGVSIKHPNAVVYMKLATMTFGGIASAILYGLRSRARRNRGLQIFCDALFGLFVPSWLSILLDVVTEKFASMAVVLENGLVDFHRNGTPRNWIWNVTCLFSMLGASLWANEYLAKADRYGIPKPAKVTLTLWASAHLVTALAMFGFAHDASQTYKPEWTDVLG